MKLVFVMDSNSYHTTCSKNKWALLFNWVILLLLSAVSIWACLPRTQRGQPIVLGVDPKGKKLLYVHGNSVIIRDIEVSRTLKQV